MFKLFKKKQVITEDPILEMLNKKTEDLRELNKQMSSSREAVEKQIAESEKALRDLGYLENDINRIKFNIIK